PLPRGPPWAAGGPPGGAAGPPTAPGGCGAAGAPPGPARSSPPPGTTAGTASPRAPRRSRCAGSRATCSASSSPTPSRASRLSPAEGESMVSGAAGRIAGWVGPHVPEASDGILTSAGICEGFAGAGVGTGVLIFAGFAGLVAGTLAMGAVEYSKFRAELDQQTGQLAKERVQLETTPGAELDELTQLYASRGLSPGLARQVAVEL